MRTHDITPVGHEGLVERRAGPDHRQDLVQRRGQVPIGQDARFRRRYAQGGQGREGLGDEGLDLRIVHQPGGRDQLGHGQQVFQLGRGVEAGRVERGEAGLLRAEEQQMKVVRQRIVSDEAAVVRQQLFDGDGFLTVGAEGRKVFRNAIAQFEFTLLDDQHDNTEPLADQFIHTQLFALVDRSGKVRGIYDGLDKKELAKLNEDINLILKERYDGPRFVNGIFQNNPN